jgi:3-methylcrotonyl-CoA carboxylase alpha subunit
VFRKLLIANRGEIACRIARTARRLGVRVVALYSEADSGARHVRLADESYPIGPASAQQSYLNGAAILAVAQQCGAEAIHPGYGFLSESAPFAAACAGADIAFVGPPPQAIAAMGEKAAAKERMQRAGVPVLPGYQGEDQTLAALERHGLALGLPLIIKPSGGGGGKGMQIVRAPAELRAALEASRRVAISSFADERLLLERYLSDARHVEVQVLADRQGAVLHLLDRDCSVQRRHQKLIEEAPAPALDERLRAAMAQAACAVAREVAYIGAGTVEFLVEGADFFFMEMNTRLQVEHGVTEAVTGIDLVEWQLRIAAGEALAFAQADIAARGHAIEARVCAEDPAQEFLPASGRLRLAVWPRADAAVRVDAGFETGDAVPPDYDSLLAKIIAHRPSRAAAITRLRRALGDTRVAGLPTNLEWLAAALDTPAFRSGAVTTEFVARHGSTLVAHSGAGSAGAASTDTSVTLAPFAAAAEVFSMLGASAPSSPWALADGFRAGGAAPIEVRLLARGGTMSTGVRVRSRWTVEVLAGGRHASIAQGAESAGPRGATLQIERRPADGALLELRSRLGGEPAYALVDSGRIDVWRGGGHVEFRLEDVDSVASAVHRPAGGLTTALPGVVVAVRAAPGERVSAGQPLLVIEAMKMEHTIRAPRAGVVAAIHVRVGDRVSEGDTLARMDSSREDSGREPSRSEG